MHGSSHARFAQVPARRSSVLPGAVRSSPMPQKISARTQRLFWKEEMSIPNAKRFDSGSRKVDGRSDSIAGHFTFRTQPLFRDLSDAKQWLEETDEPPEFSDSYGVFEEASFKERNFQWSVSESITYRTVSTTVRLPNFQEGNRSLQPRWRLLPRKRSP